MGYLELASRLLEVRQQHSDFQIDPAFAQAVMGGVCLPKTDEILDQIRNEPESIRGILSTNHIAYSDLSRALLIDEYLGQQFIIPALRAADKLYRPGKPLHFIALHDLIFGSVQAGARLHFAEAPEDDTSLARAIGKIMGPDNLTSSTEAYLWTKRYTKHCQLKYGEDDFKGFALHDDFIETAHALNSQHQAVFPIYTPTDSVLFEAGAVAYIALYKALHPLAPSDMAVTLQ